MPILRSFAVAGTMIQQSEHGAERRGEHYTAEQCNEGQKIMPICMPYDGRYFDGTGWIWYFSEIRRSGN